MPKMKTHRLAKKKFRVGGTGVLKHGRANTSHNTAKRGAKRRRQLRRTMTVDSTNAGAIQIQLPYRSTMK